MQSKRTLCTSILISLFLSPLAGAQILPPDPLSGLEKQKSYESRRASSSDPDLQGNEDYRVVLPGQVLTLGELEGPGKIVHIWTTGVSGSRRVVLRIYWDGEKTPSVECPIGDFFGGGWDDYSPFISLPIRNSVGGGSNCYWPMPFRKSARVTVTNESDWPVGRLYYMMDWEKYPSFPGDTEYFHAMHRQEYPCVSGKNYLLADIAGSGQYVGTVQSVQLTSPGRPGMAGDDFFFIDGSKKPCTRGTGRIVYLPERPCGKRAEFGDQGSAYRFYMRDPIRFKKSLRAQIEFDGSDGLAERHDYMSSVALWYQTEPHKPWVMPKGAELMPFRDAPLMVAEQIAAVAVHSKGTIEVRNDNTTGMNVKVLDFTPEDTNGWLEIPFTIEHEMKYPDLGFVHLMLSNKSKRVGIWRAKVDGNALSPSGPGLVRLGQPSLVKGKHTLRFEFEPTNKKGSKVLTLPLISIVTRTHIH